jgi:hypothetical protein
MLNLKKTIKDLGLVYGTPIRAKFTNGLVLEGTFEPSIKCNCGGFINSGQVTKKLENGKVTELEKI